MKERVLIFNSETERSSLLSSSLLTRGYEVVILPEQNAEEIQNNIHLYQPNYIVMEDDELIALATH